MKYFSLEIVPVSTCLWAEERNKGRPSPYDNNVKKVQHSWSQVCEAFDEEMVLFEQKKWKLWTRKEKWESMIQNHLDLAKLIRYPSVNLFSKTIFPLGLWVRL